MLDERNDEERTHTLTHTHTHTHTRNNPNGHLARQTALDATNREQTRDSPSEANGARADAQGYPMLRTQHQSQPGTGPNGIARIASLIFFWTKNSAVGAFFSKN